MPTYATLRPSQTFKAFPTLHASIGWLQMGEVRNYVATLMSKPDNDGDVFVLRLSGIVKTLIIFLDMGDPVVESMVRVWLMQDRLDLCLHSAGAEPSQGAIPFAVCPSFRTSLWRWEQLTPDQQRAKDPLPKNADDLVKRLVGTRNFDWCELTFDDDVVAQPRQFQSTAGLPADLDEAFRMTAPGSTELRA